MEQDAAVLSYRNPAHQPAAGTPDIAEDDDKKDLSPSAVAGRPHSLRSGSASGSEAEEEVAAPTLGYAAPERKSANPLKKHGDYPPMDFHSWDGFKQSLGVRVRSIFTKRFLLCILWGQVLSLCITLTNTATTTLGMNAWELPTTQSFFVYFFLMFFYVPYTIYSYGFKAWTKMLYTDGWKYLILAAIDVEANYSVVLAYQYTDILSASLLNAWATPACMIVAYFLVKARYHWSQILGALICIGGLVLLIVSDFLSREGMTQGKNKPKGNGLMILGATLYGLSNSLEEFFVRNRPLYEVVGSLGLFGTIINGAQASGLEHNDWIHNTNWSGTNIGYLVGFVSAMLLLYTTAPLLFRFSSSPFYNLSLLTSAFWSLLIGFRVFGYHTYWLYGLAFPMVIIGLLIYFSCTSPAHQADESMVVKARGKKADQAEQDQTANSPA